MILKAKERGNAPQLARYLLAMRDARAQREAAQEELLRLREDIAHYMRDDRHDPDHTPTRKREKTREEEGRKRERAPRPHRRRGFEP